MSSASGTPSFYQVRHPLVGGSGEAHSSLLRYVFNTTLSGSGSNTHVVEAQTAGTYTLANLEPNATYVCEAVQLDSALTAGCTISLLTLNPPQTLCIVPQASMTEKAILKTPLQLVGISAPLIHLDSASHVGSLSVKLEDPTVGTLTSGQVTFYLRKYPADADMVDISLSSYTVVPSKD